MTTDAQDRTLNELFDRPDVETLTALPYFRDDLLVLDHETGRIWRITPAGDLVTPNALDPEKDLIGSWDFPAEFQTDEAQRVAGDTVAVDVEGVYTENDGTQRVYFRVRREDEVQTLELVEFLGQLGRTYGDLRRHMMDAAEETAHCETCGEPIDYCQGHGEIAAAVSRGG